MKKESRNPFKQVKNSNMISSRNIVDEIMS